MSLLEDTNPIAPGTVIVKCPHCGAEMILDEVYYRDDFSGHPINIIRDTTGKLIYVDYEKDYEPVFEEHLDCVVCGKPFIAEATLTIKSKPEEEELDFSDTSSSLI